MTSVMVGGLRRPEESSKKKKTLSLQGEIVMHAQLSVHMDLGVG